MSTQVLLWGCPAVPSEKASSRIPSAHAPSSPSPHPSDGGRWTEPQLGAGSGLLLCVVPPAPPPPVPLRGAGPCGCSHFVAVCGEALCPGLAARVQAWLTPGQRLRHCDA